MEVSFVDLSERREGYRVDKVRQGRVDIQLQSTRGMGALAKNRTSGKSPMPRLMWI